jgi:archaellum component FlaC
MIYIYATSVTIALLISLFVNANLLKKFENLEEYVGEINTAYEFVNEELNQLKSKVAETLNTMRTIDSKGLFESDDEVGTAFKQLVEIVNELNVTNNAE